MLNSGSLGFFGLFYILCFDVILKRNKKCSNGEVPYRDGCYPLNDIGVCLDNDAVIFPKSKLEADEFGNVKCKCLSDFGFLNHQVSKNYKWIHYMYNILIPNQGNKNLIFLCIEPSTNFTDHP